MGRRDGKLGDHAELWTIGVRPDRQGRGLGRQLVRAGVERVRSLGIRNVSLVGQRPQRERARAVRVGGVRPGPDARSLVSTRRPRRRPGPEHAPSPRGVHLRPAPDRSRRSRPGRGWRPSSVRCRSRSPGSSTAGRRSRRRPARSTDACSGCRSWPPSRTLERRKFGPLPYATVRLALIAGIFFAGDLTFWHHAIEFVGAGLATVLGNLQVLIVGARCVGGVRRAAAAVRALGPADRACRRRADQRDPRDRCLRVGTGDRRRCSGSRRRRATRATC